MLFHGKINQPYIDIEAIRSVSSSKVDEVMAGIRITSIFNQLNQLKLEIFPNISLLFQQKIASYLLGNYNVMLSYIDINIITSLLIGAGVSYSEKFFSKVGKIFGVQDLTLNAQNTSATLLLELSGSVTPGLQIKYGIGVFDLLTTITVRYCLSSQFYLEVLYQEMGK